MAGLPPRPQQHVDGVNLTPLLEADGPEAPGLGRDTLYWHFPHYHGSGNRPSAAIRAGDWKLVHWFEDGSSELYDLEADVGETRDLAPSRPNLAADLQGRLLDWLTSVDANLPTVDGDGVR
jgi:arylsulfatase A-like enzyme